MTKLQAKAIGFALESLKKVDVMPAYNSLVSKINDMGLAAKDKEEILSAFDGPAFEAVNKPASVAKKWLEAVLADEKYMGDIL